MEFEQLIRERYSVRKFDAVPVEEEKLQKIMEAGRLAPTGHNSQPQRVYVVRSEEGLKKIRELCVCAFNAPAVLMVSVWCPMIKNVVLRLRPYFASDKIDLLRKIDSGAEASDVAAQGYSFPAGIRPTPSRCTAPSPHI